MTFGSRRALRIARAVLASAIAVAGLGFLADRPGLTVEYFADSPEWIGKPIFTAVEVPAISSREDLQRVFLTAESCSVRWRGWLNVERTGSFGVWVDSDEGALLVIDEEILVDRRGSQRATHGFVAPELEAGFHPVEVGLAQTEGDSRLSLRLGEDASAAIELPGDSLYARRPVVFYRALRRATSSLSVVQRQLLGSLLLLVAFGLLRREKAYLDLLLKRVLAKVRLPSMPAHRSRALRIAVLAVVFLATWLLAMPFTTSTTGGDDIRYLIEAAFGEETQGYGRPVHVNLLRLFIWLSGGDVFLGARALWAFIFAATVTAIVVAVGSFGGGSRARTLAVAMIILFSQANVIGRIGATFPDFTAMMFSTLAFAAYFRMLAGDDGSRWKRWLPFVIGASTSLAFFSKETGAIAAGLPVLFLWHNGRADVRRCARRLGYWAAGALGGLLLVIAADAWAGGDFWRSVRPEKAVEVLERNFEKEVRPSRRSAYGWMNAILQTGQTGTDRVAADYAYRHLWILTFVAAFVATAYRKRLELRLLHLLPVAYMLMMMLMQTGADYLYSSRYLLPIFPLCCLLVASMFRDLGIEEPSWTEFTAPKNLVPVYLALVYCLLIFVPLRLQTLEASDLLPASFLAGLGWTASDFLASIAEPFALLAFVAVSALWFRHRNVRFALLVACLLLLFGVGLERNRVYLMKHLSAQRGDLILYPWRTFQEVIEAEKPQSIQVSPELFRKRRMVGPLWAREHIARMFFRRRDLKMWQSRVLSPEADLAIAGRHDYNAWRRQIPGLEETAVRGPTGQLILVRPRQAARSSSTGDDPSR